jgi:hypothetical protein
MLRGGLGRFRRSFQQACYGGGTGTGSATQWAGFTTSVLPNFSELVLDSWAWIGSQNQVPASAIFSRGTMILKPGEQLTVLVKGAASAVALRANLTVESYPVTMVVYDPSNL